MGNHQFAMTDFDTAINIDEEFSEAFYRRGVSQLKSRRFHEAISDFRRSMDLDTNGSNPGVYDGQGCCYHALQDYELALDYFH
jgi:tetratricopeptide (TPR) repeat protein